jgi:hypothetical protein
MAKSTNVELLIKNVRFSYLYCFQPYKGDDGKENYCSHFILPPDHPQMGEIKAAILSVVKAAYPEGWEEVIAEMKAKNKICLKDGSAKGNADGYKGMKFISGNKKTRFSVVETRNGVNVQLTQADGRPLSGDFGNAKVEIYYMSHPKGGKMVNCGIQGIQYVRKGTPLGGGGRVADTSEFGIDPADADGEAPATAGGSDDSDLLG